MKKKLLKILGWLLLIGITLIFYDNFTVMTGVVVALLIMNYGPGIFITIGKKILLFVFDKITGEFKPRIKNIKKEKK